MSCNSNQGWFANDNCCTNSVQDKVCLTGERTLVGTNGALSEQIYFSNTRISSTGYFKILELPTLTTVITLQFLYNNVLLNIPAAIDPLGNFESVAFTVINFDEIRIDSDTGGTIRFELSLTPRYSI